MTKVMRRREGDEVELVNGKGALAHTTIKNLIPGKAQLIIQKVHFEKAAKRQLVLAQGLPKLSQLDFIIEKGTELGATAFWLFPGEQSEKKGISELQKKRLTHLTISALKQSGRLYLPTIELMPPLKEWEKPALPLFFGDPKGARLEFSRDQSLIFLIGPEKGLSSTEKAYLESSLDAKGVSLNPHTLRVETAALCALSKLS